MRVIPLSNAANQSFVSTIDDVRWNFRIVETRGVMAVDLDRNGVPVLRGFRALAGEPVIPYAYLIDGNFLFVTVEDFLPNYRQFNQTQILVYLTQAEIDDIPAITGAEIAARVIPEFLTSDDGFYLTTDAGSILTDD